MGLMHLLGSMMRAWSSQFSSPHTAHLSTPWGTMYSYNPAVLSAKSSQDPRMPQSQAPQKHSLTEAQPNALTAGPSQTSPSEKGDETSLILTCLLQNRITEGWVKTLPKPPAKEQLHLLILLCLISQRQGIFCNISCLFKAALHTHCLLSCPPPD